MKMRKIIEIGNYRWEVGCNEKQIIETQGGGFYSGSYDTMPITEGPVEDWKVFALALKKELDAQAGMSKEYTND